MAVKKRIITSQYDVLYLVISDKPDNGGHEHKTSETMHSALGDADRYILLCTDTGSLAGRTAQDINTVTRADSIKITNTELIKYCGEYGRPNPNPIVPTIIISRKGSYLYHSKFRDELGFRLIPISARKFIYDDESGNTIEFVTGKRKGSSSYDFIDGSVCIYAGQEEEMSGTGGVKHYSAFLNPQSGSA